MGERNQNTINFSRLAEMLKQFHSGDKDKTLRIVQDYFEANPRSSTAEAFRALSHNKGKGKPHLSASPDDGSIYHSIKKTRKRSPKRISFKLIPTRRPKQK